MARTLCKGAEAALPTTTGAATSFTQATVVRLVNTAYFQPFSNCCRNSKWRRGMVL